VLYQRKHGKFPDKLDALVPEYMKEIPSDRLNGTPLVYKSIGDGMLLYSFGYFGKDNQGYNDNQGEHDDIAIFTENMRPAKPKEENTAKPKDDDTAKPKVEDTAKPKEAAATSQVE